MGLLDNIKKIFIKEKEPDTEEYRIFKKHKELKLDDIERFKGYIEKYSSDLDKYIKEGRTHDDLLLQSAKRDLDRFTYSLYEAEKSLDFIRENTDYDIEYRRNVEKNFASKLKDVMPDNLDLRFHGTPIYFAKEILDSKTISSSADRFDGYIHSTDNKGEFSVSDINSLSRTVNWFLDIESHQRGLPCGALFVLTSDGQTEQQHKESLMDTVDFNKEPERLYAVVSTPENMNDLKTWVQEAGLSSDLVFTFDGFIQEIEKIAEQEKKIEDYKYSLDDMIEYYKNEDHNYYKVENNIEKMNNDICI